jgi:hypothetical protein
VAERRHTPYVCERPHENCLYYNLVVEMTVLEALRKHREGCFVLDLQKDTGLKPNELYNALAMLERRGLATSHWVPDVAPGEAPRRRKYVPVPQ